MRNARSLFTLVVLGLTTTAGAVEIARAQQRSAQRRRQLHTEQSGQAVRVGALQCSVWEPAAGSGAAPLVVFSHGFHGNRNQSTFLTSALAKAGYFVVAPDHKDAMGGGRSVSGRPEVPFRQPQKWTEASYQDRAKDIRSLLTDLKADERFGSRIDWSKLALSGHSLGGYTVLGLAGAWPGWRLPDVKAVLALSPYANPFLEHGDLSHLGPVMYQGGTLDVGITPFLIRPGGVYDKTGSPAYLVELTGASHLAWTDLNPRFQRDIVDYAVAFLNRHVKGDAQSDPAAKRSAVVVRSK